MSDHENGNGDKLMQKINQTVENGLLKLLSRGMVIVGLPVAAWISSNVFENVTDQFKQLNESNVELRDEIRDLNYQVTALSSEITLLKNTSLTPYDHALEHQKGIFRYGLPDETRRNTYDQ